MNGVTNGFFHTTGILASTPIILYRQSKPLRVPTSSPRSGLVQQQCTRTPTPRRDRGPYFVRRSIGGKWMNALKIFHLALRTFVIGFNLVVLISLVRHAGEPIYPFAWLACWGLLLVCSLCLWHVHRSLAVLGVISFCCWTLLFLLFPRL